LILKSARRTIDYLPNYHSVLYYSVVIIIIIIIIIFLLTLKQHNIQYNANMRSHAAKRRPGLLVEDYWERKFLELKAYYHNTDGDDSVVTSVSLRRWVDMMRRFYHKGRLTKQQIQMLESIGFSWKTTQKPSSPPSTTSTPSTTRTTIATTTPTPTATVTATATAKAALDSDIESPALLVVKEQLDGSIKAEKFLISKETVYNDMKQYQKQLSDASSTTTKKIKYDPSSELKKDSRISVYWSDDDCWYDGNVISISRNRQHMKVEYEQGHDRDTIHLQNDRWSTVVLRNNRHEKKQRRIQSLSLNSRLQIWWPNEQEYYQGTLKRVSPQAHLPHYVVYDDGDKEWTNLEGRKFRLEK
jgi:hypothetical protein